MASFYHLEATSTSACIYYQFSKLPHNCIQTCRATGIRTWVWFCYKFDIIGLLCIVSTSSDVPTKSKFISRHNWLWLTKTLFPRPSSQSKTLYIENHFCLVVCPSICLKVSTSRSLYNSDYESNKRINILNMVSALFVTASSSAVTPTMFVTNAVAADTSTMQSTSY